MINPILNGWISLIIGCISLIFRNFFARKIIECQNNIGFNFGEKEVWQSKIVIVIVSICFIVIGILAIFQIIK
ncbi:MAG: hypothetical protein ACYDIC_04310 [Desulfobaccales bacterium]